ncbi:DUF3040 domain-containing protein [Streptomyces pactum]|uniref:DUF3040 domain-containing protein n=1 Tax=Streptomyces pactum TaxID=68249 RepID=A0A1S6J4W6_9ACTN|nr:DUF3040 domain-containing protein [Streptomyces pactum]AQS66785.1 hypothetical protein B1H29_07435 [Streptomyces pactum]
MSAGRLSDHEQRVLDEVERALCRDRGLDRRLRTLRLGRCPGLGRPAAYRPRTPTVLLLLTVSVTLLVTGIVTSEPAVIWSFAAVWPVTLFAVFRLLCRWTEG